jgi:hypothetical protein
MNQSSMVIALANLGYIGGYATVGLTFTIWEHETPEPTVDQLIAAGLDLSEFVKETIP